MNGFFFFHPAFVHFPIALYFLETGLLVSWAITDREAHLNFAALSFRWGYFFMLLSMLTGFLNAGGLRGIVGKTAVHFYWALALFVFYTGRVLCQRRLRSGDHRFFYVGSSVLGSVFVTITAYCGGMLVY